MSSSESKYQQSEQSGTPVSDLSLEECPPVTIVVVARNERRNIGRCISSIAGQEYQKFSLVLVDDGSTDETVAIARTIFPSINVISSPRRSISANREIGWRGATTPFVAFLDADCEAPPKWLLHLVCAASATGAAAVGGGNRPPSAQTKHYDALSVMLQTFAGSRGSVQGKVPKEGNYVEHLPGLNVLYRTDALRLVGGFDPMFARMGEDEDLSRRLTGVGLRLYVEPKATVIHWQRRDLASWASNMRGYGRGRTWLLRRHPNAITASFLVPPLTLLLWPVYLPVIAIYSTLLALKAGKVQLSVRLFLLFVATHLAYGLGQIEGFFLRGDNRAARSKKPRVLLRLTLPKISSAALDLLLNSEEKNVHIAFDGPSGFDIRPLPTNKSAAIAMMADMNQSRRSLGGPAPGLLAALLRRIYAETRFKKLTLPLN